MSLKKKMEQLNWTQTDKIIIATVNIDEKVLKFSLEKKIINNLINHTPRIYYFKLNYKGKTYDYIADFNGLKPLVRLSKTLSIKIKSNKPNHIKSVSEFGNYVIARGESFMDRYMGISGWQTQEYNFELIVLDEANKPIINKITSQIIEETNTIQQKDLKTLVEQKTTSLSPETQKCKNCGAETMSNIDVCPNCFALLTNAENDVDFAI